MTVDKQDWSSQRVKFIANLNMGQSPPSEIVNRVDEVEGFPFLQGNAEFGDEFPSPVNTCSEPSKVAKCIYFHSNGHEEGFHHPGK